MDHDRVDTERMAADRPHQAERRLPMALAVIAAAALHLLIPEDFMLFPEAELAYPAFLLGLLGLLVVGDPGRIDRTDRWLRVATGVMIGLITLGTAMTAARLVVGILEGAQFDGPVELLTIGVAVWTTTVIAFSLWYWHLDRGGPAERARGPVAPASFHFPEQQVAELAGRSWQPQFVDYFALSYYTAAAFSPTDVSAVRPWAKLWMIAESAISLSLLGLVLARAINVL